MSFKLGLVVTMRTRTLLHEQHYHREVTVWWHGELLTGSYDVQPRVSCLILLAGNGGYTTEIPHSSMNFIGDQADSH